MASTKTKHKNITGTKSKNINKLGSNMKKKYFTKMKNIFKSFFQPPLTPRWDPRHLTSFQSFG